MNRTIAAISTPIGQGGIAVIRISGEEAVKICDTIYKGKHRLSEVKTHTINYGHIVDKKGNTVDEVLVSVMRAPRTYTMEDVVEISTHGGIIASRRVLELLVKSGARPAEPGEFTKRAFMNGRIDLAGAEAVIDIINAKTDLEDSVALNQVGGRLGKAVDDMCGRIVNIAASMQVAIDYPDEDLEEYTTDECAERLLCVLNDIKALLATSRQGRIITEGVKTAIVGRPNVGKSSLLNYLAGEERAIVTDIAGTTRDVLEELVDIGGVAIKLMDTAGIRQTNDYVEKIGVERSKKAINDAELVIVVLDAVEGITEEDLKILEQTEKRNRILLVNKTDVAENTEIKAKGDIINAIAISAKTGEGISMLAERIKQMFDIGELTVSDKPIVTNVRHVGALTVAADALENAINSLKSGLAQDFATIDINNAITALGEITGKTASEEIVSSIFHSFCVGK